MNRYTVPRRSARLASLSADNDDDAITIGNFELVSTIFERARPGKEIPIPCVVHDTIETIPTSKWQSIGYADEDSRKYVQLQKNIQGLIKRLQSSGHSIHEARGKSSLVSPVEYNKISANFGDDPLPHDHLLCPHWKSFSAALMKLPSRYNTMFVGFSSIQLDKSVLEMLTPSLVAQNVTSLYFMENNLTHVELLMISDLLPRMPTLEALTICRNKLGNQRGKVADRLSTAIKTHPNLERLTFSGCAIGDDKTWLSSIRCHSLKSIDLSSNGISSDGAYIVAKFIAKAKNRQVSRVCLDENLINDEDAYLFACALRLNNRRLINLGLQRNEFTQKGSEILLKALYDDSSLNAISDSNHKCRVELDKGSGRGRVHVKSVNNRDVPKYYGRKSKLLTKIFFGPIEGGKTNVTLFEDVPPELFPRVFELIQHKPRSFTDKREHTLVFELLCATPSIFICRENIDMITSRKRKHISLSV